jgi:hypothetical protein
MESPVTDVVAPGDGAPIRPRLAVARMPSAAIQEDVERRPGACSAAGTPITEPRVAAAAEVTP